MSTSVSLLPPSLFLQETPLLQDQLLHLLELFLVGVLAPPLEPPFDLLESQLTKIAVIGGRFLEPTRDEIVSALIFINHRRAPPGLHADARCSSLIRFSIRFSTSSSLGYGDSNAGRSGIGTSSMR